MKMKIKQNILFALVLLFPVQVNSQYDFRKTTWGMTQKQVLASETAELSTQEKDRSLIYKGSINDLDCKIIYVFAYDTLIKARYSIIEEHTNKNEYITDYEKLKELLNKKYGDPAKERTTWLSNIYKDNSRDWGLAISLGQLVYFTEWDTESTQIWLMLHGDNHEIQFSVEYTSIKYSYLDKKLEQENQFDEL
jgi:hypothetical protein